MSTFSIAIISIIVLTGLFLFTACMPFSGPVNKTLSDSYYYNRTKDAIHYSPMGNWFELGNTKMNADVGTFEVLSQKYGKDKNNIYFKSIAITNEVDYSSFRVQEHLVYDKNNVYIPFDDLRLNSTYSNDSSKQLLEIKGANPSTFENIDYNWNKDDKLFFYNYLPVDVDYATFQILNEVGSKDKNNVYLHKDNEIIISVIDIESVKAIDDHYLVDKDNVYSFKGWIENSEDALTILPIINSKTLKVLEYDYLLVDDKVYHENILIPNADRASFKFWNNTFYGSDKNTIYYLGTPIVGVDLATFFVYKYQAYSKDKNNAYYEGNKIEGVDLATFGPKDEDGIGLFKDKNNTYRGNEIVND
ncbi:hypothetical protein EI427_13360 [Flammeovirga pectinis]|uniref:DKNYY family protein n=1 Tax=Flammeovirga pectinis TaxID=2494373 RepID=A0A3Q9FMJ1_9BACT|nr:DKNYY domain-containing protein [Flammeovirga pectinis]AZQ63191.1 hypothetical protein EI427_13360 [Flammeovirga pectinis]